MKKKFLLYLIPISINIALSVLWVIYHAYEQDIWMNTMSILLNNILLTPTILIFICQIFLDKNHYFFLPLLLGFLCSLFCPLILYIVWGFAYGFHFALQSFTTSIAAQAIAVYQAGASVGIFAIYAVYQILKYRMIPIINRDRRQPLCLACCL